MRFVGAVVAIQPNVLYGYALEAGIKELTTALAADDRRGAVRRAAARAKARGERSADGRGRVRRVRRVQPRHRALARPAACSGVLVVSLVRARGRRRFVRSRAGGCSPWSRSSSRCPGLITAVQTRQRRRRAIVGGVVDLGLGNLTAPVSRWSSAGVWLTGDYRFPLVHATSSHVFDVIVIVFAVVGVLCALLRRRWTIVVLGVDDADRALLLHRTQHRLDPVQVVHDHRRVRAHARLRRRRRAAGEPAPRGRAVGWLAALAVSPAACCTATR